MSENLANRIIKDGSKISRNMNKLEQQASESLLDFDSLLLKEKGKRYFSMFLKESNKSLENLLTVYLTICRYQMKNFMDQDIDQTFDKIYRSCLVKNKFELTHLSNELKKKLSETLCMKVYDETVFNAVKKELRHKLECEYFPLFLQSNLYKENFLARENEVLVQDKETRNLKNKLKHLKNCSEGDQIKNQSKLPTNEIKIFVTAAPNQTNLAVLPKLPSPQPVIELSELEFQKPLAESDPLKFYHVLSAKLENIVPENNDLNVDSMLQNGSKTSLSIPDVLTGWFSDSDTPRYASDFKTLSKDGSLTTSCNSKVVFQEFRKISSKSCSICNKENHMEKDCPQNCLPKLENLNEMTKNWKEVLDSVILEIMKINLPTNKEEDERNILFDKIKSIVTKKFSDANLSLFGSSNNGFGMKKSDLDICMTLEKNPNDEDKISSLNSKKIIRVLGNLFRAETEFDMVEERLSAKVPILKFRHKKTSLEGDISLYNTLALQNTDLIRTYTEIDQRTKILGHVVKHFSKICSIGDASCGSLSSYAYIIMVIYYLQNISPPVLPCLQQLNKDTLPKNETDLNIDGWDCWFNRDLSSLKKIWPYYKKNTESVGELWLGFLCFYTEKFDWDSNVVCIRKNEVLTRQTKNWTKHRLAIEDPFELSHNLAAGVSQKMGLYILKSFVKARRLFGQPIHDFRLEETRFNMEYFFNPKSLVDGVAPIGRNCFTCSKIGHQTRECPIAISMRKARQAERRIKPENRRFLSENNGDNMTIICYKCRNNGHIARDCPKNNEKRSPRLKTVTTFNNLGENYCFNCNQKGHYDRDCIIAFSELKQQKSYPNQQQNQLQSQTAIPNQLSAPQPKMIRINTSSPLNPPMLLKTSENNFQLFVNKGDQQNVFANYQQFYRNIQEFGSNQINSTSSNAVKILF